MERPAAITIWAVILTLRAAYRGLSLAYFHLIALRGVDLWSTLDLGVFAFVLFALNAVCAVGLWRNERWSVLLYLVGEVCLLATVAALANQGLVTGVQPAFWLVGLGIFGICAVSAWERMRGWPSFDSAAAAKPDATDG